MKAATELVAMQGRLGRGPRGNFPKFVESSGLIGKLFPMDDVDRRIIAELQADGRLTLTELAARVRLSVSPCHRRLRELERSGTIRGYRALVDPAAVGQSFAAVVFVTMRQGDRETVARFEKAVADIPSVVQAQRLFGEPDYLLRVACEDLAAYQRLYDERLGALPGVQRLTSTLVMKEVVLEHAPLEHRPRR